MMLLAMRSTVEVGAVVTTAAAVVRLQAIWACHTHLHEMQVWLQRELVGKVPEDDAMVAVTEVPLIMLPG